ncbi:MAG: hypothetical protein DRN24_05480, partial [Thermoplasmata archaeon]
QKLSVETIQNIWRNCYTLGLNEMIIMFQQPMTEEVISYVKSSFRDFVISDNKIILKPVRKKHV